MKNRKLKNQLKGLVFMTMFALIVVMFSLVSADTLTHQQNTDLNYTMTSNFATYCTLTTINTPNGFNTIEVKGTLIGSQTWLFEIDGSNFSSLGNYRLNIACFGGSTVVTEYQSVDVTYSGKTLNEGKAILYIGFLTLLILIFFLNFFGMGFLPKRNQVDEEGRILSITYLKYFRDVLMMTGYFLFIGITFIASNLAFAFLEEELLAQTLYMIYRISFGFAPVVVIVWIIWIFVSLFHDKQFQKMLNRGMFPQGRI